MFTSFVKISVELLIITSTTFAKSSEPLSLLEIPFATAGKILNPIFPALSITFLNFGLLLIIGSNSATNATNGFVSKSFSQALK